MSYRVRATCAVEALWKAVVSVHVATDAAGTAGPSLSGAPPWVCAHCGRRNAAPNLTCGGGDKARGCGLPKRYDRNYGSVPTKQPQPRPAPR